ncbi:MAG TPA: ABC transporter ATP-binding protein [Acidimicrobiales bacterium]|nr:ABC transporter ATP-binding protein [Acidimicrobiales bacterium]
MTDNGSSSPGEGLEVRGLQVRYRGGLALHSVDFALAPGSRMAVVGRNGAGKSSLVRAIAGLVPAYAGTVTWNGRNITRFSAARRVKAGVSLVPEGRQIFPELTVAENLRVGGFIAGREVHERRERVYGTFPALLERAEQPASQLSGGEAQMLAIGQALMANPSLIMLDEPSFGLAPVIITRLLDIIKDLSERGITVLLVEQSVRLALSLGGDLYVLDGGSLRLAAAAGSEVDPEVLQAAYLGA